MKKLDFLKSHPELILPPTATLRQAMEVITRSQIGIALICGKDRKLKGIVVDSDIRRALLQGEKMEVPVTRAMNAKPFTLAATTPPEGIAEAFRRTHRSYIPIVDKNGRLVDLAGMVEHLAVAEEETNWVVIMAGGQGTRLRPFTETTPKPMMRIGDKPLLELLLTRLVAAGFKRFIFTVNYLADQIVEHFHDGSAWGAQIEYVRERRELGTAGALSLISRDLDKTFMVMNGDVLTKVNFRALLDFHKADRNMATLCVREYDYQVPYGVVQVRDHKLAALVEKPVHSFFVNAGIYVLEPEVLKRLKKGKSRDMPDLIEEVRKAKPSRVGCFPIQEYWLDIGRVEDYKRAQKEYDGQFLS